MRLLNTSIHFRNPLVITKHVPTVPLKHRIKEWLLLKIKPTFIMVNMRDDDWVLCYTNWTQHNIKIIREFGNISFTVAGEPYGGQVFGGSMHIKHIRFIPPFRKLVIGVHNAEKTN